jgi:hypothetical protein
LVSVNLGVQMAHIGCRDFAGEIRQGRAELGKSFERGAANDRHSIIGRKVVPIVHESHQMKYVN